GVAGSSRARRIVRHACRSQFRLEFRRSDRLPAVAAWGTGATGRPPSRACQPPFFTHRDASRLRQSRGAPRRTPVARGRVTADNGNATLQAAFFENLPRETKEQLSYSERASERLPHQWSGGT